MYRSQAWKLFLQRVTTALAGIPYLNLLVIYSMFSFLPFVHTMMHCLFKALADASVPFETAWFIEISGV